MSEFKGLVYASQDQLDEIETNGSLTVGEETKQLDGGCLYLVEDTDGKCVLTFSDGYYPTDQISLANVESITDAVLNGKVAFLGAGPNVYVVMAAFKGSVRRIMFSDSYGNIYEANSGNTIVLGGVTYCVPKKVNKILYKHSILVITASFNLEFTVISSDNSMFSMLNISDIVGTRVAAFSGESGIGAVYTAIREDGKVNVIGAVRANGNDSAVYVDYNGFTIDNISDTVTEL